MNSRRLTRTPYRLISRARELRPVTRADDSRFQDVTRHASLTYSGHAKAVALVRAAGLAQAACGRSLCDPWSTIEPRFSSGPSPSLREADDSKVVGYAVGMGPLFGQGNPKEPRVPWLQNAK
jgi:hypothetical protein